MMRKLSLLALTVAMCGSAAFAGENERLVIYCKELPRGRQTFTAQSVEVKGATIELKEYVSGTLQVKQVIPTADCIIEVDTALRY